VDQDTLCFSDLLYNYVYRFNKNGKIVDRHLGRGKGPNEVTDFYHSLGFEKGYCFVSASHNYLYLFDKNWNKINQCQIKWDNKGRYKEVLNHPDPQKIDPYELRITLPDMVRLWDKNHLIMAISATHPKFNGYFNSNLYYQFSRILATVDLNEGKVEDLIGRRSPFYLEKSNIPNFDHYNFDLSEKNLFVSFWADPFIYIIDKASKDCVGKFGNPGKKMKVDYPITKSFKEAEMNRQKDWEEYGHYSYISADSKDDLIFRVYTRGKYAKKDGLQVYRNYQLMGDFDVPKGFKIIGSVNEEILASCESSKEKPSQIIYKVKLEKDKLQ
jgi:hypothetical protein